MNEIIRKFLTENGYTISDDTYYNFINKWSELLKNKGTYINYQDPSGKKRKMFTMGMAKRVASDWASILYSEKNDVITTKAIDSKDVEMNKKNTEYLQKELKRIKFNKALPKIITKASALGTAAAIIRIKNAEVDKDGNIIATNRTKTSIIKIPASQIVPLKVENEEIIDCAFVSENTVQGKKEYYIEIHKLIYKEELKKEVYEIENIFLDENGKEITKKVPRKYTINSDIPLFAILKTTVDNPYTDEYGETGLGFSVYADAIDQVEAVDITFHNFIMDFYLGGKKVFYNKKITKTAVTEVNGKEVIAEIFPDDEIRQQFRQIGDELENANKDDLIKEYNPELRVEENVAGIQMALNLLSFKCGLGTHYYRITTDGRIVTATEYHGSRQDLIENANTYRTELAEFVSGIGKAILLLGRVLFKKEVSENCEIVMENSDGFMTDTDSAKADFRQEVGQGLRKPYEYRMRFYGEDEQTAKKMLEEDDEEEN